MHMNAKRPVFVPKEHFSEIEKATKSQLMDALWDICKQQMGGDEASDEQVAAEIATRIARAKRYQNAA